MPATDKTANGAGGRRPMVSSEEALEFHRRGKPGKRIKGNRLL